MAFTSCSSQAAVATRYHGNVLIVFLWTCVREHLSHAFRTPARDPPRHWAEPERTAFWAACTVPWSWCPITAHLGLLVSGSEMYVKLRAARLPARVPASSAQLGTFGLEVPGRVGNQTSPAVSQLPFCYFRPSSCSSFSALLLLVLPKFSLWDPLPPVSGIFKLLW